MYLPLLGWAVFIFLVWIPVERANIAFCFNNYDLGIYAQALSLLSLDEQNPFLSTRGIRLFNDHFDPVLLLIAPFRELVRPDLLAIRTEMISVLLASLAPLWLWKRGVVGKTPALVAFLLILFSPMTLRAVFFPAHPGTWSLAPLAWFFAFLSVDRPRPAIFMLLLVFACKEEYPVVGAGVAAALWFQGRKQLGQLIFVLSLIWALGVFVVRPIFLGKSDFYTSAMVAGRGLSAIEFVNIVQIILQAIVVVFGPWFLLNNWNKFRKDLGDRRSTIWPPLTAAVILILIRLVGGYWENHRMAPLAIPAAFLVLNGTQDHAISDWQKKLSLLLCVAIIWPALEQGGRTWMGRPFKTHCPIETPRVNAIAEAVRYLETARATEVLASGNLVPSLVSLPGVEQVGASREKNFNFFLIEKSPYRNTWPLSKDEFTEVELGWREMEDAVILKDDQHVLLMAKKSLLKAPGE